MQVQQQPVPRVLVDVGYFHRSFGNFFVTDNRAFAPGRFDRFTSSRRPTRGLPDGGGQGDLGAVQRQGRRSSDKQDNFFTSADKYGKEDGGRGTASRSTSTHGIPGRAQPAGRHQHRPDDDGQLRDPGAVAGNGRAEPVLSCGAAR